ncbi:hypothetical protein ES707_06033 [subsurface metagenome]
MSLPTVTFVAAQKLYHEGFDFHPGRLPCGVKGALFRKKVIPVTTSLEIKKGRFMERPVSHFFHKCPRNRDPRNCP